MSEAAIERTLGSRVQAPTIIQPPSRVPRVDLPELWRYRSICLVLARRNLMVRYRQTLVGVAWAVIQPVLLMLVFTVFFGLFARLPSEGLPYPAFVFTGLVLWQMVNKILNEGSMSVVANSALVGRVYFPRVYFPISVAIASLVDLLFGFAALAILLIYSGVGPGNLLLLPAAVAIAWISALGVALALSAINATYRDVTQLLPFLSQLWMFASPIIYPSSLIPEAVRGLYFLNPLALAVEVLRHAVANAPMPGITAWVAGCGMSVLLFVGGFLTFKQRESGFADVV